MKKHKVINSLIIISTIFILLIVLMTILIVSSHYPYVAINENGNLIYNDEIYICFGEGYEANKKVESIVPCEFILGEVLGEIKPEKFDLLLYVITNNPIQAIQGDNDLNFIAEPRWQSPTIIYCKKEFYDTLDLTEERTE